MVSKLWWSLLLDWIFLFHIPDLTLGSRLVFLIKKYVLFLRDVLFGIRPGHTRTRIFGRYYFYNDIFGLTSLQRVYCEHYRLKSVAGSSPIVVDVGAHIGQFNFFAAQYLGARRVISIEPGDDAFLVLKRNALDPADCHCIASSSGPDRLTIYTSTLSSQMNTTVKNVGIVYDGQFVAKAETLDALTARMGLDHIDILKIDTEGSELSVLSASEKTLERVDVIAVEMSVFNVPSNNMFRTGAFLDQKRFRLLEMDCYPAHNPMMMNGVFKKDLQLSQ